MPTIRTTHAFDAWFSALRDRQAKARIAVRMDRLISGNPGQHRNLTDGIRELKIDYGPGYRIYFTERAGQLIILLIGGDKSTQHADIERAIQIAKSLED